MKSKDTFAGTWISINDVSSVEISVRKSPKGYKIKALDSCDDELAAISEEKYDKKEAVLSFAAYWSSTGRFTRYRIRSYGDTLEITYTHTDSEVLIRKPK